MKDDKNQEEPVANQAPKGILFTIEELNAVLNSLGEIPYKQSVHIIDFIRSVASKQM